MEDVSLLLTDEFFVFTKQLKEIHEKKMARTVEMKAAYESFQEEIKALESEAENLKSGFETFCEDGGHRGKVEATSVDE